jgi:hypothetical protein
MNGTRRQQHHHHYKSKLQYRFDAIFFRAKYIQSNSVITNRKGPAIFVHYNRSIFVVKLPICPKNLFVLTECLTEFHTFTVYVYIRLFRFLLHFLFVKKVEKFIKLEIFIFSSHCQRKQKQTVHTLNICYIAKKIYIYQ